MTYDNNKFMPYPVLFPASNSLSKTLRVSTSRRFETTSGLVESLFRAGRSIMVGSLTG